VHKRRNLEAIEPSLFGFAAEGAASQAIVRPFEISGAPIFLGTSSFTASGWEGSFYPKGMKSSNYLSYYARQFRTVEVDSTFYGTPAASTVKAWYEKTPTDFVFAAKVPQVITHDKVLVDCDAEYREFAEAMGNLKEKLGPLVLQFPKFDNRMLKGSHEFLARLDAFLKRADSTTRFSVEIRNKDWLDSRFLDALRGHSVALALTDTFVHAEAVGDARHTGFGHFRLPLMSAGLETARTSSNKPRHGIRR
jgi:uncharacterized protein YecE (DUF72 family)